VKQTVSESIETRIEGLSSSVL